MSQVFFNGEFMPLEQVHISPLDRGFLFGDGVYEVILYEQGHFIGLAYHLSRLYRSLGALRFDIGLEKSEWLSILTSLIKANAIQRGSIYIHISRGAQTKRSHVVRESLTPTILVIASPLPAQPAPYLPKVRTELDTRWQNCHIKSTALLANVMYLQDASDNDVDEVILYNQKQEITEGASSNVFLVFGNEIRTPPLEQNILPGVTRKLLIDMLKNDPHFTVNETSVTLSDLAVADEVWLTSSTKNIAPVVQVDDRTLNNGKPGPVWQQLSVRFEEYKLTDKVF